MGSGTHPGDDGAGTGGEEQEEAEGSQERAHGVGTGAVVSPAPPLSSAAAPRLPPPYITPSTSANPGGFISPPPLSPMISE